MLFSIIIAAYNVAPYIKDAVDSCLYQVGINPSQFEIIVIDDGSTDDTPFIIDKYKTFDNVQIVHQKNKGLSSVRNNGLSLAQGDYILYLDGDDWLSSDALSKLIPLTLHNDLIFFPMVYAYKNGEQKLKDFGIPEKSYSTLEFLHLTIGQLKNNVTPAQCKCYKRDILIKNNQKFILGILHEDGPYFMDTMHNFNSVIYTKDLIYYYRQDREGSICAVNRKCKNFYGILEGQKHVIETWGMKNPDVNCYLLVTSVLQPLFTYSNADKVIVIDYYKKLKIKKQIIKLMFSSTFNLKIFIQAVLLVISPNLQRLINKIK